jgi:hypothetical protein
MKAAFTRRLEALEKRLLAPECDRSAQETEFSRRLLERLEAGRRRVAEARERRGLPPTAEAEPCDAATGSRTIIEILHAGRYRSALAHQALAAVKNAQLTSLRP